MEAKLSNLSRTNTVEASPFWYVDNFLFIVPWWVLIIWEASQNFFLTSIISEFIFGLHIWSIIYCDIIFYQLIYFSIFSKWYFTVYLIDFLKMFLLRLIFSELFSLNLLKAISKVRRKFLYFTFEYCMNSR